jgi:hypothetical protein
MESHPKQTSTSVTIAYFDHHRKGRKVSLVDWTVRHAQNDFLICKIIHWHQAKLLRINSLIKKELTKNSK